MLCYDITATAPATKNIEDVMVRLCKLSCATIITVARGWQIIYPIGVPLSPALSQQQSWTPAKD